MLECAGMSLVPSAETRMPLGKSGLAVAPLGWGMWRFGGGDRASARRRVEAALEVGCTLFDTADIYGYGGERGFGSAGKIHSAGVSNHTAAQVDALRAHLPFDLATVQNEFSPLVIEPLSDGTLDQAMQHGIAMLAWSPLAQGRLAVSAEDAPVEPRV